MPEERFKKPTDKQLIELAVSISGSLDISILINMAAFCQIVIDRLYDNGDATIPSNEEEEFYESL